MKVIVVSTALVSSALSVKLRNQFDHDTITERCSTSADCPNYKNCNGNLPFGGKYCVAPTTTVGCNHM